MSVMPDMGFDLGGRPLGGRQFSSPWAVHRFVDAATGADANDGLTPSSAKKTIQSAVTASARGDIIYIRPQAYVVGTGFSRYTEDVTTTLAQSDLSIIGISNNLNPEFGVRWTFATAQCIDVVGPALHLENIGFFTEAATYGILFENNGATNTKRGSDGSSVYNCVLKGKGIYVLSGGTGLSIERTRFSCAYDGTVCQLNYSCSANTGRQLTVRNCNWRDGNGTVPSGPCILIAAPSTETLIENCFFPQIPTGNAYISATGANYGLIANCFFDSADLSTTAIVEGTGLLAVACWDVGGASAST